LVQQYPVHPVDPVKKIPMPLSLLFDQAGRSASGGAESRCKRETLRVPIDSNTQSKLPDPFGHTIGM